MATNIRLTLHDLITDIINNGRRYDFLQLLRLLETNSDLTKTKLIPAKSLDFPACDINQCSLDANNNLVVELNFMGLYGKDSPLPQYFIELAQQNSPTAECLRAFLNIFSQRIYFLLYQAWRKYHPFLFHTQTENYQKYLSFLAGSELPYPSLLGAFSHNCCGLATMLGDYLEGVNVKVQPFVTTWTKLAVIHKIGHKELLLGDNSFLGDKIINGTQKIIIHIGPISHKKAFKFLPGQSDYQKFCALIRTYIGPNLIFVVSLAVITEQNYCQKLGANILQLGWRSWLGVPLTNTYQINFE
jgi:type VI secretion system protein ImpH